MARVNYEPLLDELRMIVRQLREESGMGFRRWSKEIERHAGYPVLFRQVKRYEDGPNTLDAGYLLACAIAAGVDINVGVAPRIIYGGYEGQARDFLRGLRLAASQDPALRPSDVAEIADVIDRTIRKGGLLRAGSGSV